MVLSIEKARQAKQRARENYPGQLGEYPEWRILNALVQEPDSSVDDAVQQLLSLRPAAPARDKPTALGDHPYHTFLSLIEIAKRTPPESQSKLVECVARLQKHVFTDPATGEQLKHEGYLVWTQLPALGYVAADEWNSVDVLDPSTPPEEAREYENFIALLAQLSGAAEVNYEDPVVEEMDFSFWSMRAFKEAFEQRSEGQPAPTDAAVRVAGLWLTYAADRLWANIKHGRVFGRRGDDDPGTVITREMWEGWQRGLLASQETCESEETRNLIGDALRRTEQASRVR